MSNKNIVASLEDYVKFKKFLQFFVWQSSKNADNGKTESPTRINPKNETDFIEHYGLKPDFNKIAGLEFWLCFFMCGRFNTELSTYITLELLNIIGKFENGKIVALKNLIRLDIPSISISGDLRKRCEKRNEQLEYHSLEKLGINNNYPHGKISAALESIKDANESLKDMFNEFLENYNKFYKEIKQTVTNQQKAKHDTRTLEQEMGDFLKEFEKEMEHIQQSKISPSDTPILYQYTNLDALKKMSESKKLWATHIKYLNDKSEVKYVLNKVFIPVIDEVSNENEEEIQDFLKDLKNDINKQSDIDLYITSLSANSDTLSQWRGYGKGYVSVCIGFDTKKIIEKPGNRIGIFKVEYEKKEEEKLSISIKNHLSCICDMLARHPKEKINKTQYSSLLEILFRVFAKTKHPSWREEQEYRLIYQSKQVKNGKKIEPKFRVDEGKGYLIPYLEENLFDIKKIILPQSSNFESVKIALEKVLKKNGFDIKNIEIEESEISIAYDTPSIKLLEIFAEQPISQPSSPPATAITVQTKKQNIKKKK